MNKTVFDLYVQAIENVLAKGGYRDIDNANAVIKMLVEERGKLMEQMANMWENYKLLYDQHEELKFHMKGLDRAEGELS